MIETRPTALPVRVENIPQSIKDLDRWVLWKYTKRKKPDGSHVWAKLPVTPGGSAASSTDPSSWSSYDDAADALLFGSFDGLGFVLGDGIHGIDLDDCLEKGHLDELSRRIIDSVDGYAEISPSGTGVKVLTRTNLDAARVNHELGLELYKDGRYFTITGHVLEGQERLDLPGQVQDLGWLVEEYFGQSIAEPIEASADDFENFKGPLDGWDLQRVVDEVLVHLDPDCGYSEWLKVGQALHHQGRGEPQWLDAWDQWSAGSMKYVEGDCEAKWRSFHTLRSGAAVVTLASLLAAVKPARAEAQHEASGDALESVQAVVQGVQSVRDLERAVRQALEGVTLEDVDREILAKAIQTKSKELGTALPIKTVRDWLPITRVLSGFVDFNEDGSPKFTIENLQALLDQLNVTVRYNVIKKCIEILIPGETMSSDNKDNSCFAWVSSQCERAGLGARTALLQQYLIYLADKNLYNPVADWIMSQPWDGVSRLEQFYNTVKSSSEIRDKLLRKWLVQCVGAALCPEGIANQGVLTFVGPQGVGKTTWFQRLAPSDLDVILTGHTLDTKSKDSIFIALTYWIVELGEVDATMRKSDISALKSFITQPLDKLRRPYAVTESTFGRRTTFGASVNDEQYLHDPSGNRRFWSIPVVGFNLDHNIEMQQLWAEVAELYLSGERWVLNREETSELAAHNSDFTVVDPIEERILDFFPWEKEVTDWEWVTATEALLRVGVRDPGRGATISAGRVLKRVNGGQRRKSNGKVLFAVPAETMEFLQ